MKKTSKMITAVLALCMVIGLLAVTASAKQPKLLILGDSIAAAFGLDDYVKKAGGTTSILDGVRIEGSYAAIVADALKAEMNIHTHSGWRAGDVMSVVEGVRYVDMDKVTKGLMAGLGGLADGDISETIDEEHIALPMAVADADCISLNFGANDIYTYSLCALTWDYDEELSSLGIPDFENINSFTELTAAVSALIGTAKNALTIVSALEAGFDVGLANMKEAFPKLLDFLTEKSKDGVKIFVNSVNCPFKISIDLSEDIALRIRLKTDYVADEANKFIKNLCKQYDNVYFVDTTEAEYFTINDVDLSVLETGVDFSGDVSGFLSLMKLAHPNENGHVYMAEQILDAMARSEMKPEATVKYNAFGQVNVQWNKIDGAVNYLVYRATEENGEFSLIGATPATGWIDAVVPADTTCYYKVVASMDALGTRLTEESDVVSFSTHFQPAIGRTISNFIKTVTNMVKEYFRSPLFAAKVIASIVL